MAGSSGPPHILQVSASSSGRPALAAEGEQVAGGRLDLGRQRGGPVQRQAVRRQRVVTACSILASSRRTSGNSVAEADIGQQSRPKAPISATCFASRSSRSRRGAASQTRVVDRSEDESNRVAVGLRQVVVLRFGANGSAVERFASIRQRHSAIGAACLNGPQRIGVHCRRWAGGGGVAPTFTASRRVRAGFRHVRCGSSRSSTGATGCCAAACTCSTWAPRRGAGRCTRATGSAVPARSRRSTWGRARRRSAPRPAPALGNGGSCRRAVARRAARATVPSDPERRGARHLRQPRGGRGAFRGTGDGGSGSGGDHLREGGNLVAKLLQGEELPDLLALARRCFARVRTAKPAASRGESSETFLLAFEYFAATEAVSAIR